MPNDFLFYDGEVRLQFDEKSHSYYRVLEDGTQELQDGVTQTCNIIDHSIYLMPWAVKMMEEKLLRSMPRLKNGDTKSIPFPEFVAILKDAKKRHKDVFDDSRDIGLAAHLWLEDSIRWAIAKNNGVVDHLMEMAPTDERAVNCGEAAFKWMQAHNVRWIKTERKIYSRRYKYAGTMDGLAKIDSCDDRHCCGTIFIDELSLVDWKSSNQLRTEYLLQTAAYQQAEQEEFGCDIKSRWILRLGKDDGKFQAWYAKNFEQDLEAFLLCLCLKRVYARIELRLRNIKQEKKHGR